MEERRIELPEDWGGMVPTRIFIDEAKRIAEEGEKRRIVLRIMGGVAIRIHSLEFESFARKLGRLAEQGEQEFTDLDFMAYRSQRKQMQEFFKIFGYSKRPATLSTAATERQIYFHPKGWFHIDVFFDVLKMNHDINFVGRLELDYPTITPTDLLLEKLQIVQFTEKDLKDSLVLLRAHKVGGEEKETINMKHTAEMLSKDWGFWYTVTTNLNGIKNFTAQSGVLNDEDKANVTIKIDRVLEFIEKEPKSFGWKRRAIIGNKMKWYRPVETTETIGEFGIWRLRETHFEREKS